MSNTISIAQILKQDEGIRQRVYRCTQGKKTVGIGFNMDDPSARTVWAEANIKESFNLVIQNQQSLSIKSITDLLYKCIDNITINAKSIFPKFDEFPQGVQLGILSMLYQLGATKLRQFKNTVSLINAGEYEKAADNAMLSLWAKQTPARAKRVTNLFRGDFSGYTQDTTLER